MKPRIPITLLAVVLCTTIAACTSSDDADVVLPELSDESCKPENIEKLKRLEDKRTMYGSCAARGKVKKSTPRNW
jgi:entry exclusion lipoprotein TrbK